MTGDGVRRAPLRPTLGWMRVALALMVVDLHYGFFREHIAPSLEAAVGPLAWVNDGALAVFGFFSLSGYLVADMIVTGRYPVRSAGDLVRFTLSRWARIYPLYWLVLVSWLLIQPPVDWVSVAANVLLWPYGLWSFFYDQARFGPLFDHLLLVPAWTLALDLVLYPLGAVLVFGDRRWLWACIALSLAWWAWAASLAPPGAGLAAYSWWHFRYWTGAGSGVLAFALGLLLRREAGSLPRIKGSGWLAAGLVLWCAYLPIGLGYFSAGLIATVALAWIVHLLAGNGRGPQEAALGNFTYALYLLHAPVIYWASAHAPTAVAPWAALFLSLLLALLTDRYFERPVERWRRRWFQPAGTRPADGSAMPGRRSLAVPVTLLMSFATSYYFVMALGWAGR